jgi:putative peptidoglycan lipid II flippase
LGDVVVATLFQSGVFHKSDTIFVWMILCGSTVGLLAATQGRLLSSAFYALHDTQTPLLFALVRLVLTGAWGWAIVLPLRAHFGWSVAWSAAGLTASAGVAGWVEFALLKHALAKRVGKISMGGPRVGKSWLAAIVSGGVGVAAHLAQAHYLPSLRPIFYGPLVLGAYGGVYLSMSAILGQPEALRITSRLRRVGATK